MAREATLLGLVSGAYQAAVDPDAWPDFLVRLSDALGGTGATLHWFDKTTREHLHGIEGGLQDEGLTAYTAYYWKLDPRAYRAMTLGAGHVFSDYDIVAERQMDGSEFYVDFLAGLGLRYCLNIVVLDEDGRHCGFGVHREQRLGPFESAEAELAHRVLPHLRRAIQIQDRLRVLGTSERSLAAALDRLAMGAIFVDGRGRPLHMNRAAEAILHARDGLASTPDGLATARPVETARLRKAVFEAAATGEGSGFAAGGAMRVSRPSGRRPYEVLVAPLPRHHERLAGIVDAAAVVFVADPERRPPRGRAVLTDLYRLTPAEAELAEALAAGRTLAAFAEETGRGRETVRKTLKQVFAKTGTDRQAELVRLLLSGPFALVHRTDHQAI